MTVDDALILARSINGDEASIEAARELLRRAPELAEIVGGNAAAAAVDELLKRGWKRPIARTAIEERMKSMRLDLAGASATPLERLLVERIVVCWLQMSYADWIYEANAATADPVTIERLDDRRDRAHRRFLSASKGLAEVRRLLVPSVQFNVAQQQIVANGRDAKQPNLVSPTPPEAFPMAPAATEKDQKPMLTKRSKQPNSSRRGDA